LTPQQKYMTQAQYDKSIAGTDLEIKTATATQPAVATPPVVKAPPKTADPEEPKTPPVVKTPPVNIPVIPAAPTVATRGPGGKTKKTPGGKFKFGAPQQPRGKIGRRQNPQ